MKPVFVCQLTQEEQQAIRTMLTDMILHGCDNDPAKVQEYYDDYGSTLEEVLEAGMDSKVVDLAYVMDFYAGDFQTTDADERYLENAQAILAIPQESRNHKIEYPFIYPDDRNGLRGSEKEDEWER